MNLNLLKQIRDMESAEFGFIIFSICGSVCPGILAIWLFDPALIETATTTKLIILAFSIMMPAIAANSYIIGMTTGADPSTPKNKTYLQLYLQSGVSTLCLFMICLALRFFFAISLKTFLIILLALELVFYARQTGRAFRHQVSPGSGQPDTKLPPDSAANQ
jgi:hypothetical protein